MATGSRDKVAIIGMGCTKFGERLDVKRETSGASRDCHIERLRTLRFTSRD